MATTKAKTAKKSGSKKTSAKSKATSTKAKTTAKSVAAKTTKKEKVTAAKSTKPAVVNVEKTVKTEKTEIEAAPVTTPIVSQKANPIKEFFARKGDKSENILTIFKDTKIVGALIGEIIGTGLVTAIALTLGLYNPLYVIFAYIGIIAVIFKLSGAHLNPIITAGMMATRRVSAIRGVLYLIAQILGAWFGFMVVTAFYNAGVASGNIDAATASLPSLAAIDDIKAQTEGFSFFWAITMLEFMGAIIIAFFYARALNYKRGVYTFAALAGSGVFLALVLAVVISGNLLGIQDTIFVLNPATSIMYGLLPATAEGFDALMNALMPMVVAYVLFPVLGGIIGFFTSDIAAKLSDQELAN